MVFSNRVDRVCLDSVISFPTFASGDVLSGLTLKIRAIRMNLLDHPQSAHQAAYALSTLIADGATLEESLNFVYEGFAGLLPYDRIGFADVDLSAGTITARWSRSKGAARMRPGFSAPVAGSSLQFVLQQRRPRILNDLPGYLMRRPKSASTRLMVMEGVKSSMTCPLHIGQAPVGLLFLSSYSTDTYNDSHLQIWKDVAVTLAMLIRSTMPRTTTSGPPSTADACDPEPGSDLVVELISGLRPGMTLRDPLCLPGGALLIAAETVLTQPLIDGVIGLRKSGVLPAAPVKVLT